MAAVDQHSKFREDPWGRLERTTNFVLATTYGDTAAAEAAAARVRKVHERIHGIDPVDRAGRTRRAIPTCSCGSTRSRSSRSCSRTAPTPGGSPRPTPIATSPRWRASPRWSSCRRAARRSRSASCATTCDSVQGLLRHACRVRRSAGRDVPADAPPVPAAVGDPDDGGDRHPARLTRDGCTGSRGSRPPRCRCAPPCSRSAGCLNLVTPTPPALRAARARVRGRAAA